MGGKERETLGSKCLAGLQLLSYQERSASLNTPVTSKDGNAKNLKGDGSGQNSGATAGEDRADDDHIIVFRRSQCEGNLDVADIVERIVKGDRLIISIEQRRDAFRNLTDPRTAPLRQQCSDIEDFGSTDSTPHRDHAVSHLVEPNLGVGQVVKITPTEVHLSLRKKPKRLLRFD